MMTKVFLDTSYAIALLSTSDLLHLQALKVAEQLVTTYTQIVTTRAVLLEIGNALCKRRFRPAAVSLLNAIEQDPFVDIVPLSDELYNKAFALFANRQDKEWGLIDCVSFIVMLERNIQEALTTDKHFEQMGFRALLKR